MLTRAEGGTDGRLSFAFKKETARLFPVCEERCNDTDWNGRRFEGKNATLLRESCGLSVSVADHHRSGRYNHYLPYRWVWDVRRNCEESCSVGTLISGRALQ